jgi:hypothetical protein
VGIRATTLSLLAAGALAVPSFPEQNASRRLTLPTDWPVATQHRYRVSWERKVGRWELPEPPPRIFETSYSTAVTISVVRRTDTGYVLRWEPLGTVPPTPPAADMEAGGLWAWHRELALPLEVGFTPGAADERLTVLDDDALRARLAADTLVVLRNVLGRDAVQQMEADCQENEAAAGCASLARRPVAWRSSVGTLLGCAGLSVDLQRAESWSAPHPHPDIGPHVAIEHRKEVVAFDPGAPVVRIRTSQEPNGKQMKALLSRHLAQGAESPGLMAAIGDWNVRVAAECVVDRRTGWPVSAELHTTGSSQAYESSEIVRLERE